jgi:hypothetical protein
MSEHDDMPRSDGLDDIARRAARELRADAPSDGVQRLRSAQRARQVRRTAVGSGLAVLLVAGGAWAWAGNRHDDTATPLTVPGTTIATQPSTTDTSVTDSSTVPNTTTTSTISTTSTTTAPTTTTVSAGALKISYGSFLPDYRFSATTVQAAQLLGIAPVVVHPDDFSHPLPDVGWAPCLTSTGDHWAIYADGLTLLFEGSSMDTAVLTNWVYVGGAVGGFTELVVQPSGITIGDSKADALGLSQLSTDLGDAVDVPDLLLRFGVAGDTITWIGRVDCAAD